MDITEIAQKKLQMEYEIAEIIRKFNAETGCKVDDINLYATATADEQVSLIVQMEVKI